MRRVAPSELCLLLGGVAVAIVAAGVVRDADDAIQAWLAAYLFWIGLPVGALFLTLTHRLTGGAWGRTLRPALMAMAGTLPLLALLFIPVLIGLPHAYRWARAGEGGWLDPGFFAARTVAYLVLWNALALVVRQHAFADRALSAGFVWPALVVLFATSSLAAFDWVMSLEPHWTSTIFGLLVTAGWVLSALGFALAYAAWCASASEGQRLDAPARLLLAMVILWAYLAAVQWIVIWESNLTAEISWYLKRGTAGWQSAAVAFMLLQFALPFLMLLWRPVRRTPVAVLAAAVSVIVGDLLTTWWLTLPEFARPLGWLDPLGIVAIGGCVLFFAARGPLVPFRLPRLLHGRG